MAAYYIGTIQIRDPKRWSQYVSRVGETVMAHGGEVLFRGELEAVMSGAMTHENVVALRFANSAAAMAWHESDSYQALIPLRDAAANVTLVLYSEKT
jgi:uncharacterized protein (DUF1330 family)